MNIRKLLQKGYFPKELPPPFSSDQFSRKSASVLRKWNNLLRRMERPIGSESNNDARKRFREDYVHKYGSSSCMNFSLAKGIHSRRQLGIPNPKQYHDLCKIVVENWAKLKEIYNLSDLSASKPVESGATTRSVRTKSKSLNEFKFQLIDKALNKRFELRLDINSFYPSIYTHSISWAIMGRDLAKKYFKLKSKSPQNWSRILTFDVYAKLYAVCELLDTLVRNCQERQSVGLPIGPDISFILAEIIGNRMDSEILEVNRGVEYQCTRYYDDYYFYVNTYGDAEKILKNVQGILNAYSLETNESKVKIKELPFSFEPPWISTLSAFRFTSANKHEVLSFFSVVFQLVEENPNDSGWIITHGLGRFEYGNIRIPKESWEVFLNLLIKTMLIDPSNIDKFLKIVLSYKGRLARITKIKIGGMLQTILETHLGLNHAFEISWALWIAKSLLIKIDSRLLGDILHGTDYISKVICLDLISSNLFKGRRPSLTHLENDLDENDLFSEKWLFSYESIMQGWLTPSRNIILGHEYFKILSNYRILFYDPTIQISPEFNEEEYRATSLPF
jgi:hypothetical protein